MLGCVTQLHYVCVDSFFLNASIKNGDLINPLALNSPTGPTAVLIPHHTSHGITLNSSFWSFKSQLLLVHVD